MDPDPPTPARQVPWLRGLTFKQAAVTLLAVSVLGVLVGGAELFLQWRALREEIQRDLAATLALVRGSAAEAAYQLHPELARQLIDGLLVMPVIAEAELRDNFGQRLAEGRRAAMAGALSATLLARLFADIAEYRLALTHDGSGAAVAVGELSLRLSTRVLGERFLIQARDSLIFAVVRVLSISVLVVGVFYFMITRPLLRLSAAMRQVDPARPGLWKAPRLSGHRNDELGLLVADFARLLADFQNGLHQRDAAEQQLRDLTARLESRVAARTAELGATLADLNQRKTELEQAFDDLDRTHAELTKANRLVLESIRYARRIQRATLPDARTLDGAVAELAVYWEPLHDVGGDWFWLESFGDEHLVFLADCTGHGVPGALMTLVVAAALDGIPREPGRRAPGAILAALDRRVRARLRQDRPQADAEVDDGLQAAVLLFDPARGRARFAGAGMPLLHRRADGRIVTLRGARAQLGYASLPPPRELPEQTLDFAPGDTFYLFTDGMTDQMGGTPRRLLGRQRLVEIIERQAEQPLGEQIKAIETALRAYRDREPRRDDMTLIALRPRAPTGGA